MTAGPSYSVPVPQAIWTGSISFGLVSVPVRMITAVRSKNVSFNQLERSTGARIRYQRVSEKTGEPVANDDIVKGYEIEPSRYVVVEARELDAMAPKKTSTIEIVDFVDLAEIDPIYFDSPYYVTPDKNARKPYDLLLRAMTELGKVAIGRVVVRNKEHLVAIRPLDDVLCVEMMRWSDEVVPTGGLVDTDGVEVNARELAMAKQLIEALSSPFDPTAYRDEYREQVLGLIERKAAGEEIVAGPAPEEPAKVLDLMAALRASLQESGRADDGGGAAESEPSAATKATTKPTAEPTAKSTAKSTAKPAASEKAAAKTARAKKPAAKKAAAKRRSA